MATAKKVLIFTGVAIGLGVAWYLGSPLFITDRVDEDIPGAETQITPLSSVSAPVDTNAQAVASVTPLPTSVETLSEGTFTGFDENHQASGTARIIRTNGKTYVRFENDFVVTNGPDLFVHLGNDNTYNADTNLGRLKGNEGSQNYEIPSHINPDSYSEVWVWCRAFSVPFGKAVLQ